MWLHTTEWTQIRLPLLHAAAAGHQANSTGVILPHLLTTQNGNPQLLSHDSEAWWQVSYWLNLHHLYPHCRDFQRVWVFCFSTQSWGTLSVLPGTPRVKKFSKREALTATSSREKRNTSTARHLTTLQTCSSQTKQTKHTKAKGLCLLKTNSSSYNWKYSAPQTKSIKSLLLITFQSQGPWLISIPFVLVL